MDASHRRSKVLDCFVSGSCIVDASGHRPQTSGVAALCSDS